MERAILMGRLRKAVWYLVLFSFIIPVLFLTYKIIIAPASLESGGPARLKSDYVLMLVQCILGLIAMLLPVFLAHRFEFRLPSTIYFIFVIFLYCAIFLGEVRSFYYTVPHWDTILHTFSGGMLGSLGFTLVSWLNKDEHTSTRLSPLFVAIFAFCFGVALGTLWEIYEFTFDGILRLNMQKFMLEDGTPLTGREALRDTMKDLCVDVLGALAVSAVGFISLKVRHGKYENLGGAPVADIEQPQAEHERGTG